MNSDMVLEPAPEVLEIAMRLRFRLPVVALRGVARPGVASDADEMFNLK